MANKYQCTHCNNIVKINGTRKSYTCKNCNQKTEAVLIEGNEPQTEISIGDDKPISLDFDVKNESTEFTSIKEQSASPEIKNISKPINTPTNIGTSGYLKKPFTPESAKKVFEQLDILMVKKSNNQIWDVTKEEEQKLAEAYTDVLNEYFPEMRNKEAKLGIALVLTLGTYTPRILQYVEAYRKQRKNKGDNNGQHNPVADSSSSGNNGSDINNNSGSTNS